MDPQQSKQLTFGLVVVAIGLMLFASQLDWGWNFHIGRLWPAVFVALAVGHFASSSREAWKDGAWFLFLAVIFFMHTFYVLRLTDSWPLFVVAAGVSFMFPKGPGCGSDRHAAAAGAGSASTVERGQP